MVVINKRVKTRCIKFLATGRVKDNVLDRDATNLCPGRFSQQIQREGRQRISIRLRKQVDQAIVRVFIEYDVKLAQKQEKLSAIAQENVSRNVPISPYLNDVITAIADSLHVDTSLPDNYAAARARADEEFCRTARALTAGRISIVLFRPRRAA